jgi:hypothetical protein
MEYSKVALIVIASICASILTFCFLLPTMGQSYNSGLSYQPFQGFEGEDWVKIIFFSVAMIVCSVRLSFDGRTWVKKYYKKIIFITLVSIILLTTISLGIFREVSGAITENNERIRMLNPVDWVNFSNLLVVLGVCVMFAITYNTKRIKRIDGLTIMAGLAFITLDSLLLLAPTWTFWPVAISEYGLKVGLEEGPVIDYVPSLFLLVMGAALATTGFSLEWARRRKKIKIPVHA